MPAPTTVAHSEAISDAIAKLAQQILTDYPHDKPLFVALLRGAAPFSSKLMFAITKLQPDYHPELDYMTVKTYGSGRKAGAPEVVTDIDPRQDITGRTVIILDDVLDKGITADFVQNHLLAKGASSVKLAVLVDKQTERVKPVSADYACLTSPDVWLVGMGMDDGATSAEAYRWRDEILDLT